ncbi:hypothetical protein HOY80DRAFT_1043178 [Tuber brumale]|nr:hypothetical protein HOY80DRAFT_1043178 [Tuber brumale]
MSIESLPNEIVLGIVNYLATREIASLRLTNHRFSILLSCEIFYSVIRQGHPTACQQALFEAALRDDRELIRELIRRGILEITGRSYRPLIHQAICEFHSAETIRTLQDCLAETCGIGSTIVFAQRMRRGSAFQVLFQYLG